MRLSGSFREHTSRPQNKTVNTFSASILGQQYLMPSNVSIPSCNLEQSRTLVLCVCSKASMPQHAF